VVFTSVKPANGNSAVTSDSFTPVEDGTYHWVVSYAGDANNNPISDNGSSSSEQVIITETTPTLTTLATPSTATVGQTVTLGDTAILTGQGPGDAGTVIFTLTAPSGSTVYTSAALPLATGANEATSTTLTLTQVGTYTWHAVYNDEGFLTPDTGVNETVTVGKASPTIHTRASAGGPEGSTAVFDTATLSGGFNESGNITFQLEDAGNHVLFTSTKPANGNSAVMSDSFTPAEDGTYHWVVSFAGDASNNPISDNGSSSEQVVITEVTPTLTTSASPTSAAAGATLTLSDTATLAGQASGDVGTVTFTLTAPNGSTVYTSAAFPETGNFSQSTSTTQTLTQVGPYVWHAIYNDEGNITDDDGVNETVTVGQTTLALSTQASPGGPEGTTAVFDTATLSGGNNETGNIVFNLEDASNNVVFTSTKQANGNSAVTSDSFTPTEEGTYHWVVSYAGDASNNPISDFTSPAEEVTITDVTPTLTTLAAPSTATVGKTVTLSDIATLAGQASGDTGTVTFTLTAPDGSTIYTTALPETGDFAQSTSTMLTLTQVGTYTWDASYNDDGNITDDTGVNETLTVAMASPQLSTQASAGGPEQVAAVFDTATLSGGFNATGDIIFNLEDANNNVLFTSVKPANGNNPVTSDSYTPVEDGTYHWVVSYAGDANNNPISDNGSSSNEQVVITEVRPTLRTLATPRTATVGQTVILGDTAILTGQAANDAGTVTFTLTAPDGSTIYTSAAFPEIGRFIESNLTRQTLSQVGSYTWHAVYNDEGNITTDTRVLETVTVGKASPTLTTTPNVTTVTLSNTAPPVLTDTASLSGGFNPTGTITFELFQGSTLVDSEMATVTGNATYTTQTGFTLPPTGTAAGGYVWIATYTGDGNNNSAIESNPIAEAVLVNPAIPTLVTSASPVTVTLPAPPTTLTDTVTLSGGYNPTGSIVFTLTGPSGTTVATQTDLVTGNGTYMATAALPTTGTVAGTYTWTAIYEGDTNNTGAVDQGGTAEQTLATKATLSLITIASPNITLPTGPPGAVTLTDSAFLSGGASPTGSITFTLIGPNNTTLSTQSETVNGNNTYTAGFTLPTTGAVAGTYTWMVTYSGDANNNIANDQGGVAEQTVVSKASPTLVTTASPAVSLPAGPPGTVTLTDTANLLFGYYTTGSITFTLLGPGGTPVGTPQTDTVQSGINTYRASITLPTTGTVAGTYTWQATYTGDANNNPAADQGLVAEQTVVGTASPTLVTLAGPAIRRVTAPLNLTDSAVLSGGYFPSGNIVFTLTGPGAFVYTQTDTVNGNGAYTASTTLLTTGTVAGTYTWTANYSGDASNNAATDQGGVDEKLTVAPDSPTLVSTARPPVTLGATPPTLSDSADLEGGFKPTGAITFTLTGPGGFVFTQTDTVNGNGVYTAGAILPTTGLVAGAYTWTATYGGDPNDNEAIDQGGPAEQTVVSPARPAISTTPDPTAALQGTTLQDTAVLTGGYFPTGSITFRLYAPGVDPTVGSAAYAETVTVSGNGAYDTSVGFVANAAGTWHWVAAYNGDSNNKAAASRPLDEPVTIPPQAVLTLTKTVDDPQPLLGENVAYTFTLVNAGPGSAFNVSVSEPFPTGLIFVSAAAPRQGVFDPTTDVWTVGTMAAGAQASLQITAEVMVLGPIVNTAIASAVNIDPSLSDLASSAAVTTMRPANLVSKQLFLDSADPPPVINPADAVFVAHLYRDLLGRNPDAQGLTDWSLFLAEGGSRAQVVLGFESSYEYRADEVNGVYLRLLHRAADPAGLGGFVNFLGNGGTLQQVESLVAGSPEYVQDHGGTTAGFLSALYADALGRPIDPIGETVWNQLLAQGASPAEVALAVESSLEADQQLVAGLYTQFLHRPADPLGAASWVNALKQGVSDDQLTAAFLSSGEYYAQP
jgi:uncharacterized repeat protein (TIGR01451 family)